MVAFILESGLKFDGTITLGNIITALTFIFLAIIAWRDMNWRVKNLEDWRKVHEIDAHARDELISRVELALSRITALYEAKRVR
jgi:hypothetical protein